jgi:tagatose-1,6-bisphosphate aldolase
MVTTDKQALWDIYFVASVNQGCADRDLAAAVEALRYATQRAENCKHYADAAYDAWSNA